MSKRPQLQVSRVEIDWYPQPVQARVLRAAGLATKKKFIRPKADLVATGGSAGGGKSDVLLVGLLLVALRVPGSNCAFFRRTYPELSGPGGAIMRSHELYSNIGRYTEDNHRWTFHNGSIIQFMHCQRETDVTSYQSQQFDVIAFDEATHFTEYMVRYLITRNRATVDNMVPFVFMATNPGNVGHLWFKQYFVDSTPWEQAHDIEIGDTTERRLFIRAKLEDNKALLKRDPRYLNRLMAQPEKLREALLHGNWDVFEGQYFDSWVRDKHVVKPVQIPSEWPRWRAVDWGYSAPWCCLWIARQPGTDYHVVYREAYGAGMTDPVQAAKIMELTPPEEQIEKTFADPSMWTRSTRTQHPTSPADVYDQIGVPLTKAVNDRIPGWQRIRELMEVNPVSGLPNVQIFETCSNLIRTLPAQIHDERRVEDMNTDGEDHASDAFRYGVQEQVNKRRVVQPTSKSRWAGSRR